MQEILLEEAHPLAINLSFAISLGLLPVTLSLRTASCGIKNSGLPEEEAGDLESSSKESNPAPVGNLVFDLHEDKDDDDVVFVCLFS